MTFVIDASAVLAILRDEEGAPFAIERAEGALLSAVNLTEILAKTSDLGIDAGKVKALVESLRLLVVPFDGHQALVAAKLRPATRHHNVSLADRACLALALDRAAPVLTADGRWREFEVGVDLRFIR